MGNLIASICVCTKLRRVSSCFRFHLHWDWNLLENNRLNQSHILMPGLVLCACYSGPHSNSQHLRKRSGIRVCRALYPRSPTGSLETERCPCMKTVCDVIFQISLGKILDIISFIQAIKRVHHLL